MFFRPFLPSGRASGVWSRARIVLVLVCLFPLSAVNCRFDTATAPASRSLLSLESEESGGVSDDGCLLLPDLSASNGFAYILWSGTINGQAGSGFGTINYGISLLDPEGTRRVSFRMDPPLSVILTMAWPEPLETIRVVGQDDPQEFWVSALEICGSASCPEGRYRAGEFHDGSFGSGTWQHSVSERGIYFGGDLRLENEISTRPDLVLEDMVIEEDSFCDF